MSENITELIWQTCQMNHENYLRHYALLNKVPSRESWTPVDEALYGVEDIYRVRVEEADKLRFNAIKYSFNYHYVHNRFYRNLCEQRDVKPEDIRTLNDLPKIPLVPQKIFKQYPEPKLFIPWLRGISSDTVKYPAIEGSSYVEIIEKLNQYGVKVIFSSGTTSNSSMVPRDQISLIREAHIREQFRRIEGHESGTYYIGLGFDPRKIHPNWGIAHSLGGDVTITHREDQICYTLEINVTSDTINTLMGIWKGKTSIEKQVKESTTVKPIRLLENIKEKGLNGQICGPPYMIDNLLTEIEASGKDLRLGNAWTIGTGGGGWLGIKQEDLFRRIESVLGIPNRNCRDVFGQTEKGVLPSCEGHYFHIPYTLLQPFVLDQDLEPMGFDESGRWAFVDAISNSYPAFIFTDDKVKLMENCPVCGRPGPVISPQITRMPGLEDAGCSEMMRKLMSQEVAKL
jgi:long-chain-fatty-acid---luciferin-component ligase